MIRKWGAVTGTGHHKFLGERDGQERSRIGTAGAEGPVAWEGKNIYVSSVCVGVHAVLQEEAGEAGRRQYVRSVSVRTISKTFGTVDLNPSYKECCRLT